jgi:hypothetical protein
MALTRTDEKAVRSTIWKDFGYVIKMMSGDKKVPVFVTDAALQEFAAPPVSPEELPERLRQYRRQIEEIASGKHSAGQIANIENYEIVCVASVDVRA